MSGELLDRAADAPHGDDWVQAGYTYKGRPDVVSLEARHRIIRAVARVILSADLSEGMVNAGGAALGSDDDPTTAAKILDVHIAMSAARLAEMGAQPLAPSVAGIEGR